MIAPLPVFGAIAVLAVAFIPAASAARDARRLQERPTDPHARHPARGGTPATCPWHQPLPRGWRCQPARSATRSTRKRSR